MKTPAKMTGVKFIDCCFEIMLYLLKTSDYYKVGYTTNLESRMKQYASDNPLVELLGIKEGSTKDETLYHQSFYQYEGTGEWYKVPEDIINEIKKDFTPSDALQRSNKRGNIGKKNYYKYQKRRYLVKQFDLNGTLVNVFSSLKDANNTTGVNMSSIISCSKGIYKTAGGFIWKIEK